VGRKPWEVAKIERERLWIVPDCTLDEYTEVNWAIRTAIDSLVDSLDKVTAAVRFQDGFKAGKRACLAWSDRSRHDARLVLQEAMSSAYQFTTDAGKARFAAALLPPDEGR
jgi:hypothetical protein